MMAPLGRTDTTDTFHFPSISLCYCERGLLCRSGSPPGDKRQKKTQKMTGWIRQRRRFQLSVLKHIMRFLSWRTFVSKTAWQYTMMVHVNNDFSSFLSYLFFNEWRLGIRYANGAGSFWRSVLCPSCSRSASEALRSSPHTVDSHHTAGTQQC